MADPVDLAKGVALGNGANPGAPPGTVPVMPVEAVSLNGQATPILSALFLMLTDIRDTLGRIEQLLTEPIEVRPDA